MVLFCKNCCYGGRVKAQLVLVPPLSLEAEKEADGRRKQGVAVLWVVGVVDWSKSCMYCGGGGTLVDLATDDLQSQNWSLRRSSLARLASWVVLGELGVERNSGNNPLHPNKSSQCDQPQSSKPTGTCNI